MFQFLGDQVIQSVSAALASSLRTSDLVARYGGEEFAMILPMTEMPGAQTVVGRCHHTVSQLIVGEQQLRVTISAGIAEINETDDGRSLFARAGRKTDIADPVG